MTHGQQWMSMSLMQNKKLLFGVLLPLVLFLSIGIVSSIVIREKQKATADAFIELLFTGSNADALPDEAQLRQTLSVCITQEYLQQLLARPLPLEMLATLPTPCHLELGQSEGIVSAAPPKDGFLWLRREASVFLVNEETNQFHSLVRDGLYFQFEKEDGVWKVSAVEGLDWPRINAMIQKHGAAAA